MLKKVALALVFALGLATAVLADEWNFEDGKVDIHAPDHWTAKAGEGSLTLEDKDGEVFIYVELVEAKDLDEATKHLDKEIEKHVKDVKTDDKVKHEKTNGLDVVWLEGSGKVDGKAVHLMVDFVITPNHKVLMLLGVVDDSKWEKHEKDIEKVYEGIKPEEKK